MVSQVSLFIKGKVLWNQRIYTYAEFLEFYEEVKMEKGETKLKDFFTTGWGKNAVRYLKNGATIKVLIDTIPFSLSKREWAIEVSQGAPKSHSAHPYLRPVSSTGSASPSIPYTFGWKL